MPIPFRDMEEVEELGVAAIFHVEQAPGSSGDRLGALLLINARGEPLEFAYNRIQLLSPVLWRATDRLQASVRRLSLTLFQAVTELPALLLCRADAVPPHLFGPGAQIALTVPVGRLVAMGERVGAGKGEVEVAVQTADAAGQPQRAQVLWTPGPPAGTAGALFGRLAERGLLLEPFDRARLGLREVYADLPDASS